MEQVDFHSETKIIQSTKRRELNQFCTLCGSTGHFACIDHCNGIFCVQCTSEHRESIVGQMHELLERLRIYRTYQTTSSEKSDTQIDDGLQIYQTLINERLQQDRLLDVKTLADFEAKLDDFVKTSNSMASFRSMSQLSSMKLLSHRSPKRLQSTNFVRSKTVTIALNTTKHFPLPFENSFSVGQHPVVMSLKDHYVKTVFFQWRNNSMILISSVSIDVYARGTGLMWSIPLTRVFGNVKDKIFAGTWSSYLQRLILVGRHNFYFFDIDREKTRCVCSCGCGGRCSSGLMMQTWRPNPTVTYRCPTTYNDRDDSQRFLACTYDGFVFYTYKDSRNTYCLTKYQLCAVSKDPDQNRYEFQTTFLDKPMIAIASYQINFQLCALCLSQDGLVYVGRRFHEKQKATVSSQSFLEIEHYFGKLDLSLHSTGADVLLPSSIRWLTAMIPFGTNCKYLLCDPQGQQLLIYRSSDSVLIRRFRIAPINVCLLTDGRLVLWIEKAYPSTPVGKLHFITAPHLENESLVTKSFDLLKSIE